ncbi:hypothetical protein GCM10011611_10360 [Aliidongia dinghuensis]|uniref:Nucleotidyltransferase family protein n=1 Tax=Aliidongia dinghuensis TaxID=1867774 RepID=A0A8J3E3I5_9PROT|nr:nucleotidyltransferase family protein [Aliidongia dinghuensis]GGF06797.1 hypothetical protein GCM10011611_10360 [Aliidongia dinghuensis]
MPARKSSRLFAAPPEFRLLADCSVWPPSERHCRAIREAAARVDWDQALALAKRHRVEGLLHAGLFRAQAAVPPTVREALGALASALARASLALGAEALRLQARFQAAGIPVRFVKGTSLAQLVYGTQSLRHAKDIDLLVAPDELDASFEILAEAGYVRVVPPAGMRPDLVRRYLRHAKECAFVHRQTRQQVDVHWRLVDNPAAPDCSFDGTRRIDLSNQQSLETLGGPALFAYLCLHGASHGWSRLKWLADIGTLLAREDAAGIERLYRAARSMGAGRSVDQALLLCRRLFDLPLPAALATKIGVDRRARWLEAIALHCLAGAGAAELFDRRFATSLVFLSGFLLGDGWRYWLGQLRQILFSLDDMEGLPLPPWATGLYPLLRLPLWLRRRIAHGGRSAVRRWRLAPSGSGRG